jgi:hypothetical protein
MNTPRNLMALLAALLLGGCAAFDPGPAPLTRDAVVQLANSGVPPAAIIEQLQKTHTVLALSASDILQLAGAGVPREVLDYLQAAQISELRERARFNQLLYGPELSPFSRCGRFGRAPLNRFGSPMWPGC